MSKNIVISILAVCVLWLSVVAVRLENFHYASLVGMCPEFKVDDPMQATKRHTCLPKTETRTNPLSHLFYALGGE